jgi:Flp pilus assembly protein TadG
MANTSKMSRRHLGQRRGAAVVEFALTAPVFFLFLLAAFEFGWLNVMRHTADNAAYEAARTAMVPGATVAEATAKANRILNAVGARSVTITVTPNPITTATTQVKVEVDLPMSNNALVVPKFTKTTVLHSEATLKTERAE